MTTKVNINSKRIDYSEMRKQGIIGREAYKESESYLQEVSKDHVKCSLCGKKFSTKDKGQVEEHRLYHNKLARYHRSYGTFYNRRQCDVAEKSVLTTFGKSNDILLRREAAKMLLVIAYSRHLIGCLELGASAAEFERYTREWIECNINEFPKDVQKFILSEYNVSLRNVLKPYDPDDYDFDDSDDLDI